jgi:hypothetical protein
MVSLLACLMPSRISLKPISSVAAEARTVTAPRRTCAALTGVRLVWPAVRRCACIVSAMAVLCRTRCECRS